MEKPSNKLGVVVKKVTQESFSDKLVDLSWEIFGYINITFIL